MIIMIFSMGKGHRLSSGSTAGSKLFARDNRGDVLYNVADQGNDGLLEILK